MGFSDIKSAPVCVDSSIHNTNLVSTPNWERYWLNCNQQDERIVNTTLFPILVVILILAAIALRKLRSMGRPIPKQLQRGMPLPDFQASIEDGAPVRSTELHGTPAVILFVRGNWCPFCSSQVKNLTQHYKDIVDLGARLILVTPKPLETTRRVAEFFEVEFEFWLDDNLNIARSLGLLLPDGVPAASRKEYGDDTVWPTALVVDRNGIIRYAALSKLMADRPNPKTLLSELRKTLD